MTTWMVFKLEYRLNRKFYSVPTSAWNAFTVAIKKPYF